ncbi:hypothetical protein NHQ30_009325 [Ciborinia camelliae]|nr:hypothetical protein NHQ30_009325 [Ciborinia camelliae]
MKQPAPILQGESRININGAGTIRMAGNNIRINTRPIYEALAPNEERRLDMEAIGGVTNRGTVGNTQTDVNVIFRSSPIVPKETTIFEMRNDILWVATMERRFLKLLDEKKYSTMLTMVPVPKEVQDFKDCVEEMKETIRKAVIYNASRLETIRYKQKISDEEDAKNGKILTEAEKQAKRKARGTAALMEHVINGTTFVSQMELHEIRREL